MAQIIHFRKTWPRGLATTRSCPTLCGRKATELLHATDGVDELLCTTIREYVSCKRCLQIEGPEKLPVIHLPMGNQIPRTGCVTAGKSIADHWRAITS